MSDKAGELTIDQIERAFKDINRRENRWATRLTAMLQRCGRAIMRAIASMGDEVPPGPYL